LQKYDVTVGKNNHKYSIQVGYKTKELLVVIDKKIEEIDLIIRYLTRRTDISGSMTIFLNASQALAALRKYIQPENTSFEITTTLGTVSELVSVKNLINDISLDAVIETVSLVKYTQLAPSESELLESTVSALRTLYAACTNTISVIQSSVEASKTVYQPVHAVLELNASTIGGMSTKSLSESVIIKLDSSVNTATSKTTGAGNNTLTLNTSAIESMVRYRRLSEVDQGSGGYLSLSSWDSVSLSEIDYITL